MSSLQDPMAVFTFCACVCAFIFWIADTGIGKKVFSIIPSVVFIYYLPTIASTVGFLPTVSPAYDWMRDYLLSFSIFILMMTADIPTILKIGPKALVIMLIGTAGVVIGGPMAFLIFEKWLPPDTWKGLAALSGSWIGGGANFAAIKESVSAPDSIIGPIIIVDTAVGYTWMGVLLVLSNYQRLIDKWNHANSDVLQDIDRRLQDFQEKESKPLTLKDASIVLGIGFFVAVVCRNLALWFHGIVNPVMSAAFPQLASIFTYFTWLMIFVSTLGIGLSFTGLRKIEATGASKFGYIALYLFMTSIGAKANLAGILNAPVLLLVGAVWIFIHIACLLVGARLLKVPLFLVAIGSQANIGGAASAPIVATAYYSSMAPVGVLMGIFGYLIGNYAALVCAFLLRLVSG